MFYAVFCNIFQSSFHRRRENHVVQTLSTERLRRVAEMSDGGDQRNHFRTAILKPFLQTRVPDTPGNRAVRQVCILFVQFSFKFHL